MIPKDRNKKGTGFTNLGRILQASQGARLGGQVASGVQQTGQNIRQQIGQAASQFQEKAKEQSARFGEEAARERDALIPQVSSGAEGLDQSEVLKKFEDYRSGEYKGPRELGDVGALSGKAMEAEQLGRLGRTAGGKEELLRRFVGGRNYSQGAQALDTALLGLTGQQDLAKARKETRGITSELARQSGLATGQAKQLAQKADTFREETLNRLEEARSPISEAIRLRTAQAAEVERNRINEYENIRNILAQPELVRTTMSTGPDQGGMQTQTNVDKAVEAIIQSPFISDSEKDRLSNLAIRGQRMGLNVNFLLNQALTQEGARGISDRALATEQERSTLGLIDRLMGRPGASSSLTSSPSEQFQAGRTSLDIGNLSTAVEEEAARRRQSLVDSVTGALDIGGMVDEYGNAIREVPGTGGLFDLAESNPLQFIDDAGTEAWRFITSPVNTLEDLIKNPSDTVQDLTGRLPDQLKDLLQRPEDTIADLTGRLPDPLKSIASGVTNVGKTVGGAVSSAGKNLKKIFCFAPDTMVLMSSGKYKKIKDIKVNESVALGGRVISNGEALATDLFQYGDVKVTGGHAVYENGKWKRVEKTEKAYPIGKEESSVYPIVTENHLVVTKNQVWADAFEIDNFKTPDEYSLEVLNQNKPRNKKLDRFLEEYFEKDPNQFEKIKTPF
jgi:hypothetical protein